MLSVKSKKGLWKLAAAGLAGLLIYLLLLPGVFTLTPRSLKLTRDQAVALAERKLLEWGYRPGDYKLDVNFNVRKDLLRFIERTVPDSERKQVLCKLPAYVWQVTWTQDKNLSRALASRPGDLPRWFDRVIVQLDPCGNEIGFWTDIKEDSSLESISEAQAHAIADSLIRSRLGAEAREYQFSKTRSSQSEWKSEYHFTYHRIGMIYGLQPALNIIITGNHTTKFLLQFDPPQSKEPEWYEYIEIVPFLLVLGLLAIITLIFFVKKLRADEINFSYGMPPAILAASLIALMILLSADGENLWGVLVGASFSAIFSGIGMLLISVTGEALLREGSAESLLTLDALYRGRLRNRLFAGSLIAGVAYGFVLLALTTLVLKVAQVLSTLSLSNFYHSYDSFGNGNPFFYNLISTMLSPLWYQFGVLMLLGGLAVRYSDRRWQFLLTLALVFGLGFQGAILHPTSPLWARVVNAALIGTILGWIFYRYDFIATLTAHLTFTLMLTASRFLLIHHRAFELYGLLFLIFPVALVGFALYAWRFKAAEQQLRGYTPRQSLRIAERARLRRELEIARRVQLSFLPKSDPQIPGLDIASMCLPALDVGGDYYDFIPMGPRRLGVAIGDVSGKGISAAFYMTLTKGFLRSLTRSRWSPRDVMVEINSLFYENVERGHFISLIFGIFDLDQRRLTFARAGHNPILTRRAGQGRSERLCPAGNALGLDPGEIFSRVIQEESVPLQAGDVFVFYTDGFSEAMNSSRKEFGEERLDDWVDKCNGASAAEMIETIRHRVSRYAGDAPQHDDMTMVVVRING